MCILCTFKFFKLKLIFKNLLIVYNGFNTAHSDSFMKTLILDFKSRTFCDSLRSENGQHRSQTFKVPWTGFGTWNTFAFHRDNLSWLNKPKFYKSSLGNRGHLQKNHGKIHRKIHREPWNIACYWAFFTNPKKEK